MKKPAPKPIKDTIVGVRMTAQLKGQVAEAARAERRSVSQWIEGAILDALAKVKRKAK
jgi:predicted HicB family RNase H-like nuclease